MKLHDYSQNLPVRIGTVQIIAFIIFAILGVRLYHLQVNKGEYYTEKATNQRLRTIRIPAPRGAIFDRNGVLLVDSRSTYNVTLTHEPLGKVKVNDRVTEYATGLGVEPEYIEQRLDIIKKRPEYESMVIKENATLKDITWVEAHSLEFPELRIERQHQRFYPQGNVLSHALGYVGEVSPKQLEKPEYYEKGFRAGDILGKGGVEQYYDEFLRGRNGYRKVVVDSRGRVQSEIDAVPPQAGQDLYLTIDINMQKAAEEELRKTPTKRGVVIAMDPRNGEILALASAPDYNPNAFVQNSATPEGRKQISAYWNDEDRPLFNRAIQGRYPPGSTWKIPESVAGLQQGVIHTDDSKLVCGGGITIGSKFTRCMGSHGSPPLKTAITKSCDGYYYRLGLKMGIDGLIQMVEDFDFDKPTGIDLPNEKTSRTPKYYRESVEKRYGGRWIDIETVFASIGQATVYVTPVALLRGIASVGMYGKMYTPHLLKEFKEIGAVGDQNEPNFVEKRPGFEYQNKNPKMIKATDEQFKLVIDGMWGVVNSGGGTASGISIGSGFPIAGKTGTAQVAELGKDKGAKKDHAWFVGFAPAYNPEISVVAIIENSGFGGTHAAPVVRHMFLSYLGRGQEKTDEEILEERQEDAKSELIDSGGQLDYNSNIPYGSLYGANSNANVSSAKGVE